jgi:hypothetical protein
MNETSSPQTSSPTTHHPDAPPCPDPAAPPDSGRGPDGKFVKGNKGGPGNPFARKIAAMRRAFFDAVTEEDLAAIARAMIEKAKAGDVAAARLVMQYTMGKPAEAVDPDRLDEMEWQQWTREEVTPTGHEVFTGLHASAANVIARALVPAMQEEHFNELQRQIDEREEVRREEEEEDEEDEREFARQAQLNARCAERQAGPSGTPPVSPTGAHRHDDDGQRPPLTARQRDAERVLQMLDAAVNNRGNSEHRAANYLVDC